MNYKYLKYLPYLFGLVFILFFFWGDKMGHNLIYLFLAIFGIALFFMARYLFIYSFSGESKSLLLKIIFGGFILVFVVPFLGLVGFFVRNSVTDYLREQYIASIRYGYINKAGQTVIPFQYKDAGPFEHGYALVTKDTISYWIDSLGNKAPNQHLLYTHHPEKRNFYDRISDERQLGHDMKKFGNVGDIINADSATEGLNVVRLFYREVYYSKYFNYTIHFRYGFGDSARKVIIPCCFLNAFPFREGLALVADTTYSKRTSYLRLGYIDHTGHYVIPPVYEYASDFYEGKAAVSKVMRE